MAQGGGKMKITKQQLKRIIKEEKSRILNEQWGDRPETGSDLIEFAKAYAGLGDAVQSQLDSVVAAYNNSGGPDDERFAETVYEQNPNAIDTAYNKLARVLNNMDSEDGEGILDALQTAIDINQAE